MNLPFEWNALCPDPGQQLEITNAPCLALLTSYSLISVTGKDAEKFMQGQFTCNLQRVTLESCQLGASCDNKGRILAIFKIAKVANERYLVRVPSEIAASFLGHMQKFVVFFKCTLALEETWRCLSFEGDTEVLASHYPRLPKENQQQEVYSETVIINAGEIHRRLDIWLSQSAASALYLALKGRLRYTGEQEWSLREVEAGIPEVYAATQGEFLPHQFNLHAINAVSFDKGCYTGQEIIARTHYLGKLKKRLFLLTVDGTAHLGDSVYLADKTIGSVIRATTANQEQQLALALLEQRDLASGTQLSIGNENPQTAHIRPLPYSLPEIGKGRPNRL